MNELNGKTVLLFVEDLYNDFEFWYPKFRMMEAGAGVVVAGPKAGSTYKSKYGVPAEADVAFSDVKLDKVDAIIIPGGYAPDLIRRNSHALALVSEACRRNLVIAYICHAGWVLISAGVLKGRTTTSVGAIKDDMVNAGAVWVDREVVVDGNLISSRTPDDLPAFCKAIINKMTG